MSRLDELLTKAAEALEDMRNPFDHSFLVENEVLADECYGLSNAMANAVRVYLSMSVRDRARASIRDMLRRENGEAVAMAFDNTVEMQRITEELRAMNDAAKPKAAP